MIHDEVTRSVTAHIEVSAADQEPPLSRPQALVNLDRCLAHLAACGVDVIGIQASGQYTSFSMDLYIHRSTSFFMDLCIHRSTSFSMDLCIHRSTSVYMDLYIHRSTIFSMDL